MKTNPSFRMFKLSALGPLTTAIVLVAMPGPAHCGNIFVADSNNNTIGKYDARTAQPINTSLITGLNRPIGIALSEGHLFVANGFGNTIGEYDAATGATVNASLVSGLNFPNGIAVSGGHLFVANAFGNTIGEYDATTGAPINTSLITGLNVPTGIAESGGHLFVVNNGSGTIGEYTTSGATVNASLVTGLVGPVGIAVSGGNLFVANNGNSIGEYNATTGATVNASLISGLNFPSYIAISGGHLFVTLGVFGGNNNGVGEYTTSGATVNASLISGLSVPAGIAVTGQLTNISTRASVQTGQGNTIAGFIVTGIDSKTVVLRGLGPTLGQPPFNIAGALADPFLQLFDSGGHLIWSNDNWKDSQQAQIQATGLAPPNDLESAIFEVPQPGSYTAILSGKNGTTGVGLVELYDRSPGVNAEITNVSTRGFVGTDQSVMIGGFITSGTTDVVVRGLGPTLGAPPFSIAGALADPVVTLVDSTGTVVATNDNWKNTQQAAIQTTGLAPPNDLESAILTTLAAGNYTAILSGKNGGTGIGLVEVYKLR